MDDAVTVGDPPWKPPLWLFPCNFFSSSISLLFIFVFLGSARTASSTHQWLDGGGGGGGDAAAHGGYLDYLWFFYVLCGKAPWLGFLLLGLWLVVLFYLLSSTAGDYFCPALYSLSEQLRLPPAVAGATLLALGNGAPDLFSSAVSFAAGSRAGNEVGLSAVLGGAFFVSTAVAGVIAVFAGGPATALDKSCFIRDLFFLAAAISSIAAVLIAGKINLYGGISLFVIYLVYVLAISAAACCRPPAADLATPLRDLEAGRGETEELPAAARPRRRSWWRRLPAAALHLPRRLTIPVVSEQRWSKPFAIISVAMAPPFLAALWALKNKWAILAGGAAGVILAGAAAGTTERSRPPKGLSRLPWLAAGFLMSVIWAYLAAGELVALLVALGKILGISPSLLGLTVLAWGNSVGDLTANVAMAARGGAAGVQVAFSGCYAGPTFNTLVGLGISLVWSAWLEYPRSFSVPEEASMYQILGFQGASLVWAAAVLLSRGMKPDRLLGLGLLAIYCCFIFVRVLDSLASPSFFLSALITPWRWTPLEEVVSSL